MAVKSKSQSYIVGGCFFENLFRTGQTCHDLVGHSKKLKVWEKNEKSQGEREREKKPLRLMMITNSLFLSV